MSYRTGRTWGLAAAAAALLVTAVAWAIFGGRIFAPAALSSARGPVLGGVSSHAELTDRCDACHVAPWSRSRMNDRCLACHTDVRAEFGDSTRLHGAFADAARCRHCHTEHHGPDGQLTTLDAASLDHSSFGFSLATHRTTSAGKDFVCADCHSADSFAFEEAQCESCHREYQSDFVQQHVATWGSDCRTCHDGTAATGSAFDHARTAFPLTGAHVHVDCAACHEPRPDGTAALQPPVDCIGCHRADDTHNGSMGEDCAACHGTTRWEDATFDHTFPLSHGSRRPSECTVCHQDAPRSYERYTCYGCHEHTPARIAAEHRDEGITAAELPNCAECHPTGREHEGGRRSSRDRRDR